MKTRWIIACLVCLCLTPTIAPSAAQDNPRLPVIAPDNVAQLQVVAQLGQGRIADVVVTPDGSHVAIGDSQGVWLYATDDLRTPLARVVLPVPVWHLAITPDTQTLLITNTRQPEADLWDVASSRHIRSLDEVSGVRWGAWSPDGSRLALGHIGTLVMVDMTGATPPIEPIGAQYRVEQPVWSPDGRWVAVAAEVEETSAGVVYVWDSLTGQPLALDQDQPPSFYAGRPTWSPDGRYLASAGPIVGDTSLIPVWDTQTLATLEHLKLDCSSHLAAWSLDGAYLAAACHDGQVTLWDTATWAIQATWTSGKLPLEYLAWTASGAVLVGDAVQLRRHDPLSGVVHDASLAYQWVGGRTITLIPHSGQLAAATNGVLTLWTMDDLQPTPLTAVSMPYGTWWVTLQGVFINTPTTYLGDAVVASPDGSRLAILRLTTTEIWQLDPLLPLFSLDKRLSPTLWSPNGDWLIEGGWHGAEQSGIRFYDGWTGQPDDVLAIPATDPSTRYVAWSPDSHYIAYGVLRDAYIRDVRIVHRTTGVEVALLHRNRTRVYGIRWAPTSTSIAIIELGSVAVWDTVQNTMVFDAETLLLEAVAWSPDGRLLAGATADGVVVWEAKTGRELARLDEHRGYVEQVLWSPDGTRLISGGTDGRVLVWGVVKPS